jgi:hypothetical protein
MNSLLEAKKMFRSRINAFEGVLCFLLEMLLGRDCY